MLIGYARVSRPDQNLDLQIDALLKYGVDNDFIFTDKVSGVRSNRPGLDKMLIKLRKGDTVVVYKMDRIARDTKHLFKLSEQWHEQGVDFKSITEPQIDSTTTMGNLMFTFFAGLAQFERDLLIERTKAGLEAAKARGRKGGRKPGLTGKAKKKARLAESLYKENKLTVTEMCDTLEVARATFYKYLEYQGIHIDGPKNRKGK